MHYCVDSLSISPELLLVDGNRFNPYLGITHYCVVGGDAKFASIAAASILAKTARDDYMRVLDQQHPEYLWSQNKGYPTEAHVAAIKNKGITQHHRKSFALGS